MATYTDRLLVLSSAGIPTRIAASDTIELSLGNLVIGGDLTVKGDRIVNQSETVLLADNHTYVNAGYTSTVAQTGGLVVNYLPTATSSTCVGYGVFTAGVDGSSDPMVTTAGEAVFAAGDFIQVSGSVNGNNDGLYEVLSHVGHDLKIRSTLNGASGASDQVMDFTDGQFQALTDTSAVITKVNISVLRAGTDGIWESASGSSTSGFTFIDVASTAGSTLQAVYESGNTIDATAAQGDIAFTVDSVDFTVDGYGVAGSVLFGQTKALSSFEADASGTISFSAGAASDFTVTSGDLTLDAQSGSLILDGGEAAADAVKIHASNAAGGIDINAGTGGIDAYTDGDLLLGADGKIDIDAAGTVTIASFNEIANPKGPGVIKSDVAVLSLDSTGAVYVTATKNAVIGSTQTLDLDGDIVLIDSYDRTDITSASAEINISAYTDLDLDGATVHVDSSGQMDIASGADLNLSAYANLDLDGASVDVDASGAVSIGAGASSDFTVTGDLDLSASADLDLDGATVHVDSSGQMDIASGADLNLSAYANLDLDGASVDVDASGAVSIGAGASSDFTVTGDLDLSASADLDLDGATVHVDSSGQMDIASGADLNLSAYANLDLDGASVDVDASGAVSIGAGASSDFTVTGDLDLSASADLDLDGATVHMDASGQMDIAAGADLNLSAYANLDLDGASVDVDASGAVSIGAGASSDFTVTGDLDLSASADLDLDGATVHVDSSGQMDIVGGNVLNMSATLGDLTVNAVAGSLILDGGEAAADAVKIHASNAAGGIDINAGTGGIDAYATGGISMFAYDNSGFAVDNASLQLGVMDGATPQSTVSIDPTFIKLDTVGYFEVLADVASVDGYAIKAEAAVGDIYLHAVDGYIRLEASEKIVLSSGGNTFDIDPVDDSIDFSAEGAFGVAAQSASFVIADNQAAAFLVEDAAGVDYIKLDTSDGSEQIVFGNATTNPAFDFAGTGVVSMDALYVSKHAKFEEVAAPSNVADHGFVYVKADGDDAELFFYGDHDGSGLEVQITKDGFLNVQAIASSEFVAAAGGVSAGDALYIASATEVGLADATTADGKNYVVGFAKASAAGAAPVPVAALPGAVVSTGSIAGFASAGQAVYLSETAGVITVTAPTASGSTVYKVGYALTSTSILFQPQLVAINP